MNLDLPHDTPVVVVCMSIQFYPNHEIINFKLLVPI